MNDLKEKLASVKLRKTEIVNDSSSPLTKLEIDENAVSSYQNSVLDINIEHWIDLIRSFTFETQFLDLSPQDAELFEKSYEILEVEKKGPLPTEFLERKVKKRNCFEYFIFLYLI